MANILTTDAAKAALGIKATAPNIAAKPISISQMQTFLDVISNPMVQRYLTPLLDRVAAKAGLKPAGASDLSHPVPPPSATKPNITINMTGMEAFDMFAGFIAQMDPKLPLGEFNTFLEKNREKVITVFDNALGKGST